MIHSADVRRLLGELDDETVAEILKLGPDVPDLEAAAACLNGVMEPPPAGHLSAIAAAILEIVPSGEDDESDRNQ